MLLWCIDIICIIILVLSELLFFEKEIAIILKKHDQDT